MSANTTPIYTQSSRLPADACGLSFRTALAGRTALFREVKASPGSITAISARLHRHRSAVKTDLDALARTGLLDVDELPLPRHGRKKKVRAVAWQVVLSAVT